MQTLNPAFLSTQGDRWLVSMCGALPAVGCNAQGPVTSDRRIAKVHDVFWRNISLQFTAESIVPGFCNPDKLATLLRSNYFGFKFGSRSFAVWPIKIVCHHQLLHHFKTDPGSSGSAFRRSRCLNPFLVIITLDRRVKNITLFKCKLLTFVLCILALSTHWSNSLLFFFFFFD